MKRIDEELVNKIANKVIEAIKREANQDTIDFKGNFINEVKGPTYNTSPLVSINETNAKRLLDRHTKDGYVAISPCRGYAEFGIDPSQRGAKEKLAQENAARIKECVGLIKASGFSYTPVYGGFKEDVKDDSGNVVGKEDVFERSFIVYPYDIEGNLKPFQKLKDFAIKIGQKYNQDDVLVVAPNAKPTYYDKEGNVDFELGDNVSFNDISQDYFTDLHKSAHKSGLQGKPTRFSYVEAYINPAPCCLSESHVRYLKGEKFLSYLK